MIQEFIEGEYVKWGEILLFSNVYKQLLDEEILPDRYNISHLVSLLDEYIEKHAETIETAFNQV